MTGRLRTRHRPGYAMVTVLVFLAVMLSILAISQRHLAGLLRREQAQMENDLFDATAGRALARGVALLESGLPPSSPYICETLVSTTSGVRSYTVTYTGKDGKWSVQVAPTPPLSNPPAMPPTFHDSY